MSELDDLNDRIVITYYESQGGRPKRRSQARHGTRSRYTAGCSCERCRAANAEYQARWYRANHAQARDSRDAYKRRKKATSDGS